MIRKRLLGALVIAIASLGVMSAGASAQALRSSSGAALGVGTVVNAGPSTAVFTYGGATISCTLRIQLVVTNATGTAFSLTTMSFTGCVDTITGFNVCQVSAVGLPWAGIVTPGTGVLNFGSGRSFQVTLCGGMGFAVYSPTGGPLLGAINNPTLTMGFSLPIAKGGSNGPGGAGMPASGTFSASLTPVYSDANGNGSFDAGEGIQVW